MDLVSGARGIRPICCLGALVGLALVSLPGGWVTAQQQPGTAELAFQNGGRIYAIGADGSARRLITTSVSGRATAFEPVA
jgi:hypothetical protein